jgi:hypothetical protein
MFRRYKMKFSRRKYAESVRFLKRAIGNEFLSYPFRQRSVELLLSIYGTELPEAGDDHLTKKTVKELIQTRSVDKAVRQGVRESVSEREAREAAEAEQEAQAEREAHTDKALKAFLSTERPGRPQEDTV